ncbi:MAG: DUF3144 domain-containing protein [Nevskia sp.]|jgi:hypothetical protein|nr:DUF3144 domain-containing protein [Nevskia sp.]MCK9383646.1 DUF3144 domain-containing protein [Nevskia sp.]
MSKPLDPKFYSRADAFIHLANDQYKNNDVGRGEVCASFMYGAARFNAWLSAREYESGAEMQDAKDATIESFVAQYRAMLADHFSDYIANFDKYMGKNKVPPNA